ncbi:hypothetical protein L0664_08210 [Octadecabacter sp. G9-8]|uniref:DUF2244 domain-containing protein n=1 Tax=Octadecabacter dasysiphoniae TaxID=2909341 RepID=A0ABS9CUY3_9RHOB|nr:hypothetical protein [Octadecabacter dasysiphoniae]MCF2871047.1 hypothetical protein [Octadecabacter dasysiphoniae]
MKVTTTSDTLIVDNRPWVLGLLMGAFGFGLIAFLIQKVMNGQVFVVLILIFVLAVLLLFFTAFVQRDQLVLDARAGTVAHRRKTLLNYTENHHSLSDLSHVSVQAHKRASGDTYRMVFHITGGGAAGIHPFTMAFTDCPRCAGTVKTVNAWLKARRA